MTSYLGGVELYDENGYLLDINNADLEIFGVTRQQAIGLNAFNNPNIPEWASEKLKKGEDVAFLLDYNFNKAAEKGYYTSKLTDEFKTFKSERCRVERPARRNTRLLFILSSMIPRVIIKQKRYNTAWLN